MEEKFTPEQAVALRGIAAEIGGFVLCYIKIKGTIVHPILVLYFLAACAFLFYLYMPLVFSSLYMTTLGYIVDLRRKETEYSRSSVILLSLSILGSVGIMVVLWDIFVFGLSLFIFAFRFIIRLSKK